MANVGTAYVAIMPSMDGFAKAICKDFGSAGSSAGATASIPARCITRITAAHRTQRCTKYFTERTKLCISIGYLVEILL